MERMTRNEFEQFIIDSVKNEVEPAVRVEHIECKKLDGTYPGLTFRVDGKSVSPVINTESAWNRYLISGDTDKIVSEIIDAIKEGDKMNEKIEMLYDYENVKNHLGVRLSNYETRKDRIDNMPHVVVNDLALTYYVAIDNSKIVSVTNGLLASWGIDKDRLHEDAMESAIMNFPVVSSALENVLGKLSGEEVPVAGMGLNVLTNKQGMYGAAAVMYPGVKENLSKAYGGDYYLLPSSVHEFLTLPADGHDAEELAKIVHSVNRAEVDEKDRLSDHVYRYDSKSGEIVIAA
jgi:hypothetical protein